MHVWSCRTKSQCSTNPTRVRGRVAGSTVPPHSEQCYLKLHHPHIAPFCVCQIEQSTDAFVLHHPEAKYFNV